ncbi:MAG: septum formation initiator family protein [Candidatus Doudnabacteria bacterium]|nr:septum formation initiator family protein [Candidatus Doudnabacteria bacterium]
MKSKKVFSNKYFLILLLVLSIFLGRQKYIQYKQSQAVEGEKQKILAQIDSLQKKNTEIATSLEYFRSESFKQKVAREQLNLKKPGELVYGFIEADSPVMTNEGSGSQKKPSSNFEAWVKYFMGKL